MSGMYVKIDLNISSFYYQIKLHETRYVIVNSIRFKNCVLSK